MPGDFPQAIHPALITWKGSPNYSAPRFGDEPIAIVLHTMGGSLLGCDAWFNNLSSEVSAHFGVGLTGSVHQYVELNDVAWGNGVLESGNTWPGPAGINPNRLSRSIETEDRGNPSTPVSDEQYEAVVGACALILERFPSITYLMTHSVISPRSRAGCPGARWLDSGRFQALANALRLMPLS